MWLIEIKKKIFLTGSSNFLQQYDPENDKYEIFSGKITGQKIILLKNKGHIYLLAESIYKVKNNMLVCYNNSTPSFSFESVTCRPVIRNNRAFFIDQNYQGYVFNFTDFKLTRIFRLSMN